MRLIRKERTKFSDQSCPRWSVQQEAGIPKVTPRALAGCPIPSPLPPHPPRGPRTAHTPSLTLCVPGTRRGVLLATKWGIKVMESGPKDLNSFQPSLVYTQRPERTPGGLAKGISGSPPPPRVSSGSPCTLIAWGSPVLPGLRSALWALLWGSKLYSLPALKGSHLSEQNDLQHTRLLGFAFWKYQWG